MLAAQLVAPDLHVLHVIAQYCGHGGGGKLHSGDTRRFHDVLVARVEAIELIFDELSNGVRNADLHRVDCRCQYPALFIQPNQPFGYQMVDCVHH
jgi:hypothetical protein